MVSAALYEALSKAPMASGWGSRDEYHEAGAGRRDGAEEDLDVDVRRKGPAAGANLGFEIDPTRKGSKTSAR
ncbi:hypothetical protein VPNG_01128 [Cytospora leucostoma]|uniref:Uncharacterized protein n=1 Tax=Cytospora leucostoma TaxID=1230097 RepID=A0A423XL36_9PEZI|nr:hypothetical protein VPNG_01128 [Cytospora leucostoma]